MTPLESVDLRYFGIDRVCGNLARLARWDGKADLGLDIEWHVSVTFTPDGGFKRYTVGNKVILRDWAAESGAGLGLLLRALEVVD